MRGLKNIATTSFSDEANTDLSDDVSDLMERVVSAFDHLPTGKRVRVTVEILPKKKRTAEVDEDGDVLPF